LQHRGLKTDANWKLATSSDGSLAYAGVRRSQILREEDVYLEHGPTQPAVGLGSNPILTCCSCSPLFTWRLCLLPSTPATSTMTWRRNENRKTAQ